MTPGPGTLWRHHSGRRYRVLMLTNGAAPQPDARFPLTVVYQDMGQPELIWSRPAHEWNMERITDEEE